MKSVAGQEGAKRVGLLDFQGHFWYWHNKDSIKYFRSIPVLLIKASPLHNSYDYFCPIPLKSNAIVKCSNLPSIWTLPYLTAKQILRNCKATIHHNISSSSLPSANESLLPIDLWVLSLRAIPHTSFNLSSLESGASSLIPGKGSEGNQKWGRKRNYQ